MDKSPIGIFCYNKKGNLIYVNSSALEIVGIKSLDEFKKVNLFDHPQIASKKENLIKEGLIKFQSRFNFDNVKNSGYYNPNKSGIIYVNYTISAIGSIFLVQIQDITEQKEAEKSLKESESRFKTLFEHSNDAIIIADTKTSNFIQVNKKTEELTGYSREELLQMSAGDLTAHYIRKYNLEQFNLTKDKSIRIETELLRKDNKIVSIEISSSILEINGKKYSQGIFRDISERKKAENALKESEARFRSLYENSFDAILLTKPDGSIISANHAAEKIFGMAEDEIIKVGREGLVVKNEQLDAALEERIHKGEKRAELTYKRKDGSIFFGETTSSLFTDVDGVVKTSMIIRDITDRIRTEEKLRQTYDNLEEKVQERTIELEKAYDSLKESETKFRELFNQARDTIALSEVKENMLPGHFLEVNETTILKSGYTKKELLDMTPLDLFAPNSQDKIPKIVSELHKRKYATFETVFIVKDGKQIPAEVNLHIFKLGEKEVALAITRDVTERKKSEKALKESEIKFRKLFNQATDMLSLTELNEDGTIGNYIEVNEAANKRLGYTKNELLDMTPLDLYLNSSSTRNMVSEMFKKGCAMAENIQVAKDGRQIPVELNTTLFELEGKNIVLSISRDNTERKKSEKDLKKVITELERSNKELQSFAYITSHDLQEPLRTIASYAQLLKRRYEGQLDSDADDFIEFMVNGAARMKKMINGLLDYSRVGTKGGKFTEFEAENALNYALSNLGSAISENNAEISHDELPLISADESQIIRVFQNLIGNAIKFRKESVKPKIHISANKKGNEYIFSVSDNGIGLEEQYSDQIFEVFKRLHAIDEYQGAGIGLAVVKRIIDRHGGRIWVESELGKGSTFYFTISS